MPLRANNLFFVAMLLLTTAITNASPTVISYDAILSTPVCHADTPTTVSCLITPSDVKLTNLGKEFLKPPASFAGLGSTQVNLVKPLPAVPAAIFMVLSGFLCVSFVKDRRVWLAALAALLWAGQAGIQAVPQLAFRLSHRNHNQRQLDTELAYTYYLENSNRLRSDIEGTQYIGLLHHLAGIPDSAMPFLQKQESRKVTTQLCYRLNPSKNTNSFQPQFAFLLEQYSLNSLFNCLAARDKQFISFSPAFIFENLARGPPILA